MPISVMMIPIALFVCIGASIIGFPIARAYARRVEREPQQPSIPTDVSARLERMEQALDTIAIEVERISEGQRFTTKLLSERAGPTESAPQQHRSLPRSDAAP